MSFSPSEKNLLVRTELEVTLHVTIGSLFLDSIPRITICPKKLLITAALGVCELWWKNFDSKT